MMRYIFILALCALMGCDEKEVIEPLAITPWMQLQMPGGQIRRKDYNTAY